LLRIGLAQPDHAGSDNEAGIIAEEESYVQSWCKRVVSLQSETMPRHVYGVSEMIRLIPFDDEGYHNLGGLAF